MLSIEMGVLFILGIGVFGGALGAWLFQKLKVPQVVGYIAIGLLLGQAGFHVVDKQDIAALEPLNLFALGVIGFLVGAELRLETFRKHAPQFSAILLGEGMGAFFLVGIPSTLLVLLVTHNVEASVAAGVVFGAIASATDPASTVEVLWEYRARGILTTALIAVVALDDALAMTLYGIGTALAQILTGSTASIPHAIMTTTLELFGAVLLGAATGAILCLLLRYTAHQREKALALLIGTLLLVVGVSYATGMDVILATMTFGLLLVNLLPPRRAQDLFAVVRAFASPIYVIFFVLVGARLTLTAMPLWLWGIVILYVLGRTTGKILGAWWGAHVSKAPEAVRRYTGLGLFAQGGVAVGLSIMAAHHLGNVHVTPDLSLGDAVILAVTATTLIVQIIGPSMVKLAARKAGELGRNVTDQDVIDAWAVRDVMTANVTPIDATAPLSLVMEKFSSETCLVYPVVDDRGRIAGLLSLEELKNVLVSPDMWEWVVAADLMIPVRHTITSHTPLRDALEFLDDLRLEQIPVVDDETDRLPVGILDLRHVRRVVNEEVLRRRTACPLPDAPSA